MFIFLDEAGDTGLKLDDGSSAFFTVSLVLFEDESTMHTCDDRINELRRSLFKSRDFEFHFHDNSTRVRDGFLDVLSTTDFRFLTFALNKRSERLWGAAFRNKETFYKMICKFIFENARPYLKPSYIVCDRSGSRDFQNALGKYIKGIINIEREKIIRKFRSERSSQNNLLQVADYVASICHRKSSGKADAEKYYSKIRIKQIQFRTWP